MIRLIALALAIFLLGGCSMPEKEEKRDDVIEVRIIGGKAYVK